jgi:hypothetical protein
MRLSVFRYACQHERHRWVGDYDCGFESEVQSYRVWSKIGVDTVGPGLTCKSCLTIDLYSFNEAA